MYSVSRLIQRRNSLLMSNGIQKNEQKRCNSFAQHEFLIQNSNNKDVELDAALAIPSLNITDPTRKPKVELALSGLCLGSRDVRLIQDIFIAEMCRGLVRESPQPSSLQMENTYIPELPDGSEDGQFLALDLGGTNSRVILLDLKDGVVQHELVSHFHVPEYLRVGSGQDLFDFLAQCVYDFVFDKGLMDRQLPLGFTFSFPMHQHALDCGVLVTWTKSFNCPSAVGRDTVAMLREAIARRGDLLVDVVAVLNDATGTLVQGAFLDKRTAIGLIIATGSNATYLEQADCIEKWEGERHGERKVIIDLEWGAFGDNGLLDFIKTDFDIEVDSESLLPNSFTFEKYISGKYLGDLVRIILLRLTLSDLLFNGNTSEHLLQPGSFTTRYISLIETAVNAYLSFSTTSFADLGVAGLLLWMNREDTTIAVDGSMFKFHPRLQSLMETYISVLAPNNKLLNSRMIDSDMSAVTIARMEGGGTIGMEGRIRLPPMCSREARDRELALASAETMVTNWLDTLSKPCKAKNNGHCVGASTRDAVPQNMTPISVFLPDILRLATNCPFADVRERCTKLLTLVSSGSSTSGATSSNETVLQDYWQPPFWCITCEDLLEEVGRDTTKLQERGVTVPRAVGCGASAFIPAEDLPGPGTTNEKTHLLFIDAFLQNNRLDHVSQVMGYHPTYLDIFLRTQHFILRGDGPLPYDYRHFIAIMAAGRHQCSYLINLQKQEFLLQGGNKQWLKGLPYIPQKLRDLNDINKILAHRPWLLNKCHIEKLTKGNDSWSLAEVVHAIVLLAHFHSLASFVFGCGVNEELDQDAGHQYGADETDGGKESKENDTSVPEPEVGVETLMARMKSLSERAEEFSPEERTKRFEHVESQSAEELPAYAAAQAAQVQALLKSDISQFVEDATFLYQDFAKRGEISDIPTFRVQDYSWDDHGYSLVNRLYSDVGNLLDEKFKTAYNLTYYTMGGRQDVDTSRFRRAIWNYIQCMFGIRHDDYDYGEVNQLLERSLKAFIKSACCFPERVTKRDYDSVLREFKHSEKVHVNLMVLEARMQAELLYALRVVMRYMT